MSRAAEMAVFRWLQTCWEPIYFGFNANKALIAYNRASMLCYEMGGTVVSPWTSNSVDRSNMRPRDSFPEEEMFSILKGSDFAIVVINPATSCLKVLATHGLSHRLGTMQWICFGII